jgi:putative two-component system response regulator
MRALIVDDDEFSLELLQGILTSQGHEVTCARDGNEALAKLRDESIHLVITDWEMPQMNGLELCKAIRNGHYDGYVFIIMLTSRDGNQQRLDGLHAGADAFLVKPLDPEELIVSLATAQRILSLETRDLAMFALAKLSESRDPETGAHIERVQSYARVLAQYLSSTEKYHDIIDGEMVRLIFQTSPLHDIGKVGVPDNVLLKPGKLDEREMKIMQTHAALGAQTLEASLARFPGVRFLEMARDIAQSHHEKWDGGGYPQGLKGEAIPLSARIVALADVYDALTSRRVYKDAMSHAQAHAIIVAERGKHFDPDVVEAFLATEQQFLAIKERLKDEERTAPAAGAEVVERGPEVLVVDDDPGTCQVLRAFLASQGVDCLISANGQEALELFHEHRPRLIISDWYMPGVDGLELCRRVRSLQGGSHVHFIMLTIHAAEDELRSAFDAGVDDFLAKPFDRTAMMARLRAGLRACALHDEVSERHRGSHELNQQLSTLNQRLEKLAITDDLTGLYNRRQAMQRLEEQWTLGDRYSRAISIVTFDIDHFKQVNDTYGHSAGDAALRSVAQTLIECVRSSDIVCRIGGEEFLVLLPTQRAEEANFCAERCRQAVMAREIEFEGRKMRITLSAGVASRLPGMTQFTELLREADEALYAAKRAGRNAVRCAAGLQTPPATTAA